MLFCPCIEKIVILKAAKNFDFILQTSNSKGVKLEVIETKREFNQAIGKHFNGFINHQNIYAFVKPYNYFDFEKLVNETREKSIVLVLCNLTDVSNFGAIIRSSVAFGVDTIVIPKDRSVEVNSTVYKTSSGQVSKIRICVVTNISRAIGELKEKGFWSYAADLNSEKTIFDIKFPPKILLAIGSEDKGVGHAVLKVLDDTFKIPIKSEVDSLNVSVATGISLFYINSQSGFIEQKPSCL